MGKKGITPVRGMYLEKGAYLTDSQMKHIDRDVQEPNRTYAHKYREYLELNNRRPRTTAKRINELRFILKHLPPDAKQATIQDMERMVMAINTAKRRDIHGIDTNVDMAIVTKRKLKQTLKAFYRWLYNYDGFPPIVKWIKVDSDTLRKLPEDMLNEEEIKFLIQNCKNLRDTTIIALLWDTGMRIGEFLGLRIKDVTLTKTICHVKVYGKTGGRQVPLTFSVPYLVNYFNHFRGNARPEDPLFTTIVHNTVSNTPIDYPHVSKLLHDLKERTDFPKRLYLHLFRHSRATHYANFLTESQAKVFFGWAGASAMMARYVHLGGRDIDNAVFRANGMELDPNGESLKPKPSVKTCEKCQEMNEITAKYCIRCGTNLEISLVKQTLDDGIAQKQTDVLKKAIKLLMDKADPETKDEVMKIVKFYNEKPD